MEGVLIRTKEEHEIHVIIWSRFSILLSKIICMHLALTKGHMPRYISLLLEMLQMFSLHTFLQFSFEVSINLSIPRSPINCS